VTDRSHSANLDAIADLIVAGEVLRHELAHIVGVLGDEPRVATAASALAAYDTARAAMTGEAGE
jgi:hypothetical protein